ncbi:hypothetical protein NTGM5_110017 [Candidatus Nitrotoga sp. M5]|nr:hypothetical protein NTGM5_110017 [Candidatus Nitrotoga sp. M5]
MSSIKQAYGLLVSLIDNVKVVSSLDIVTALECPAEYTSGRSNWGPVTRLIY